MRFEILYDPRHIRPNSCTGRLSMNGFEVKLLVLRLSAAIKTALNYKLLLTYLQIILSIVLLKDLCFLLIKPGLYY
jgi:hypothetical protein